MSDLDARSFDEWYRNMTASTRRDEIVQATLGLPPELQSSSLLPWDGIADVAAALAVSEGDVLLDIACGRGGYGLELARRTGARLVGVDFSRVAIDQARHRAAALGLESVAEFRVGELTATGLGNAGVAAVLCIDAIQFAQPVESALREFHRVLRPAGRLVITGWEAIDRDDPLVSDRLRTNLRDAMQQSDFTKITMRDMPTWRRRERALWETAVAADAAGDPALQSLKEEGQRVRRSIDRTRRVLATATKPS
jgi:SAM-dependent methyltransferase